MGTVQTSTHRCTRKEPTMTAKTHHVAALALSLAVTLGLFSSVAGLSAPSHGGQFLVQAKVVAPQA
jgi:hypothetical protein